MNIDNIVTEIRKIDIQDGDILVVKLDRDISGPVGGRIRQSIAELLNGKAKAIILLPGMDIETLTESDMNELGWYRLLSSTETFHTQSGEYKQGENEL